MPDGVCYYYGAARTAPDLLLRHRAQRRADGYQAPPGWADQRSGGDRTWRSARFRAQRRAMDLRRLISRLAGLTCAGATGGDPASRSNQRRARQAAGLSRLPRYAAFPAGAPAWAAPHRARAPRRRACASRVQAPERAPMRSANPSSIPSGVRLRHWLGLDEDAFYDASKVAILPMGHCFPGQDARAATSRPAANAHRLARASLRSHAGDRARSGDRHVCAGLASWPRAKLSRRWPTGATSWPSRACPRILPLPHPSCAQQRLAQAKPWFEAELLPALRAEVARLLR